MSKLDDAVKEFRCSLIDHLRYFVEAAQMIGGMTDDQIGGHDQSKWSDAEYFAYAKHFHGGGAPIEFAAAWLHHIHHNPHHWQHWMFPDGWKLPGANIINGCVPMPYFYAREMIADWMSASMTYTGSWDMSDWLDKNIPRIHLHPVTAQYLRQELDMLGYADIVNVTHFAGEKEYYDSVR